jgi:hypothetical protein
VFPSLVLTGKFDENTWLAPKPAPAPVEQTPAH